MRWYKRKYIWCIFIAVAALFIWWITAFVKVNKKYKIEQIMPYNIGDTFQTDNLEITWDDMYILTVDELIEERPSITKRDLIEMGEDNQEFCAVSLTVKNISEKHIQTRLSAWTITCSDYGNGCSYATAYVNVNFAEGLNPNQEEKALLLYDIKQKNKEKFLNNDITLYVSLYPKEIRLTGKLRKR